MLPSRDVSIFLNNALKATRQVAELALDGPLPEAIREMPEQVSGRFVALDPSAAREIETAWKRVMILNETEVLYTFSFDSGTNGFTARKR